VEEIMNRMTRTKSVVLSALTLAAVAALAALPGGAPARAQVGAASPVLPAAERVTGQTEPAAKVDVPAVLRGRIAEVLAKEGQPIKKDEVIARLDTTIQQATVKLAKTRAESTTEVEYAKVARDHAKNEYEKIRASPVTNAFEIAGKKLAWDQAEAACKKAEEARVLDGITLEKEQLVLEQMTIRSPIDGYVHRINKVAGEAIDENQPIAVVVQTAKVNASFFLPETQFGKVKAGDKVPVELATNPPLTRDATVVAVDPYVDPAGHLFRVKMELDNADGKIPVGIAAAWRMGK
jgi:RND family efflux transporter MFP subunit